MEGWISMGFEITVTSEHEAKIDIGDGEFVRVTLKPLGKGDHEAYICEGGVSLDVSNAVPELIKALTSLCDVAGIEVSP
jgi:hypothetical protein